MKKFVALLLATIVAVSIIGCGSNTNKEPEPSIGDQMYEKYESIINKLEGENYDGAIEEIQAMKPAPVVQEVKITPENFFDYYDIEYRENNIERDSDGKIVTINKWDNLFNFKLKDEYTLDFDQDDPIAIGVTSEYDLKKIENVDFETGEITLGDDNYDDYEDEIVETTKNWTNEDSVLLSVTCEGSYEISCNKRPEVCDDRWVKDDHGWKGNYDITPDDHEGYVFVPVDIQITRTEGSLHIVNQ